MVSSHPLRDCYTAEQTVLHGDCPAISWVHNYVIQKSAAIDNTVSVPRQSPEAVCMYVLNVCIKLGLTDVRICPFTWGKDSVAKQINKLQCKTSSFPLYATTFNSTAESFIFSFSSPEASSPKKCSLPWRAALNRQPKRIAGIRHNQKDAQLKQARFSCSLIRLINLLDHK